MTAADFAGVLVAVLGGAAVGLERQWSGHAEGPEARFAGVRTFTMLGAIAGLSGWLSTHGAAAIALTLVAGGVAITVAGYVVSSRRDVDGTTEVAALLVMAAGVLAGMGLYRLSSGIIAIELLLLVEKSRVHSIVRRIDDVELRAGVRFAVMATVILPLLPEGPYPPFDAVRPRQLWLLVLFFSGLSFLGSALHRLAGPSRGFLLSGAIGGLISSTNVTLTFARASRRKDAGVRALACGAVAANAVLYVRVCVAVAALQPALLRTLIPFLAAPAAVMILAAGIGTVLVGRSDTDGVPARNPLQIAAALEMAALFQVVLILVRAAQTIWGRAGVLTTAAVLGLTDVDALTVSMAKAVATTSLETAAVAIAVGILANTALKAAAALIVGARHFAAVVAGSLALSAVAGAATIAVLAR